MEEFFCLIRLHFALTRSGAWLLATPTGLSWRTSCLAFQYCNGPGKSDCIVTLIIKLYMSHQGSLHAT